MSGSGWDRSGTISILSSLVCWERLGLICRVRRGRSCTSRIRSDRWSWRPSLWAVVSDHADPAHYNGVLLINGGTRITPHIGIRAVRADGQAVHVFAYPKGERILSEQTSETLRYILEQVVAEGSGKTPGSRATGSAERRQPRRNFQGAGKIYFSFLGFAPADDPQVIALITIDEPEGIYYGGTIAAPVIRDLFEVILPYLGWRKEVDYSPKRRILLKCII